MSNFHRNSRQADGRTPWCKTCVSNYSKGRYAKDPQVVIERSQVWAEANRVRRTQISKKWYGLNKETAAAAVKRWNKAHPDQVRKSKLTNEQKRRARKLSAKREEWTTIEVLEAANWLCEVPHCLCPDGRVINPNAPFRWRGTADHIIPLSRKGDDTRANLRAAHQACNSSKNRKLDSEL